MVETKGYTLEEISQVFSPSETSLVDAQHLVRGRGMAPSPDGKNRDLEDQK